MAIDAFAQAAGFEIVDQFYDEAVSGADPVTDRKGFAEMLERLLSNGARTIIVESPDRFARDLMEQLAGHDMLKAKGIALIAASAPTFFVEDTPTAVLVRQVLGAVAQFDKATTVAQAGGGAAGASASPPARRSRAARATPRTRPGRRGARQGARAQEGPRAGKMTLRAVSAELGRPGLSQRARQAVQSQEHRRQHPAADPAAKGRGAEPCARSPTP